MAAPLAAGAAALVREFYMDVEGITPSAALIKATLLNGAVDIFPGQYGTGTSQEIPDPPRPNNIEGWGRLDPANSVFPASPKVLWYHDETKGLNTGENAAYDFTLGDGSVPLKVSLVWSDYPGSPVSGGGLVNDLDLILIDPASTRHYPNNADQRNQTQIISYDDGGYKFVYRRSADNGFAVKFTPTSYPVVLDKALFNVGAWSADPQLRRFRCIVWDDDGGLPGTNLFSKDVTPRFLPDDEFGWVTIDIAGVIITEGSFFIELHYTSTINDNPYLLLDQTSPDNRSFVYDGSSWSMLPYSSIGNGDWAIRAVVTGEESATNSDRVNNVVGIDIASPAAGSYTLRVEGYNVPQGPQPYALVINGGNVSNFNIIALPDKPGDLSATVKSGTRIDLSWSDNSPNELGFKIERKVAGGTYTEIASVGADVTGYSDKGLSESTAYVYRVRSYNAYGDSNYSNEVKAVTLTAVEAFVTRFYELCLDRTPDSAGLKNWVDGLLDDSLSGSDVAYGFVFSTEFLNKNKTKEEYLQILYEAFFNRQPDEAGRQGWLDLIEQIISPTIQSCNIRITIQA